MPPQKGKNIDAESSAIIHGRLEATRQVQRTRLEKYSLHADSRMQVRHMH